MRIAPLGFLAGLFCLSAAQAENLLYLEGAAALPGTHEVPVGVYARHDDPMHAFSLAVRFPAEALQFAGLDLDSPGILTGQMGYEYSRAVVDNETGVLIVAVILDFEEPYDFHAISPSPREGQLLARLLFDVQPGAEPGDHQVKFRNGLGAPPIENVFSVAGRSVFPELESGVFTVLNPNHLRILQSQALPGGTAVVHVEAGHLDPIGGYTVVMRYPSDLLSIDTDPLDDPQDEEDFVEEDLCKWPITFCGLGLEDYLPQDGPDGYPIESFTTWAMADFPYSEHTPGVGSGRLFAAALFDVPELRNVLPVGSQRILKVTFQVAEGLPVGEQIPLTLVNGTGDPALENIFVLPIPGQSAKSVRPDLHNSAVTIVEGFRRGLVNSTDQRADLADAIYVLLYLFGGGEPPQCMKGADMNDDGKVDIGDCVYFLLYLFKGGSPPPPPFGQCGSDPTPDSLTCFAPFGC